MTPLLRFDGVALRRGGRLLFEGLDLELGPGARLQVTGTERQRQVEPDPSCRGPAAPGTRPDRTRRSLRSPTTRSRSIASCRSSARSMFWSGAVEHGDGRARASRISPTCRFGSCRRDRPSGQHLLELQRRARRCGCSTSRSMRSILKARTGSRLVEAHLASGGAVLAASHQPLPGEWPRLELGQ